MTSGDEPAFPVTAFNANHGITEIYGNGLTKREHFAGQFMAAFIANCGEGYTYSTLAVVALNYADALLAALAEKKEASDEPASKR